MKYGFKKVIALSMLVDSILTALSPLAANLHYSALIAFRFVIGMAHGVEMASITSGRPWLSPTWLIKTVHNDSFGSQ